jgi:hypothetical protein
MEKSEIKKRLDALIKEAEELKNILNAPDAPVAGRWKPVKGERYWYFSGERCYSYTYVNDGIDEKKYASGNCYKTEKQAQSVIDLKKHIYKFEMPYKGTDYLSLCGDDDGFFICNNFKSLVDLGLYHAGIIMNIDSTEEDQEERIRLLELVYNTK